MLEKFFDKFLEEDEKRVEEEVEKERKKEPEGRGKINWKETILPLLVFLLAAGVRLFFLFVIEDPQNAHPGWYEDVYHHWQIAHLSFKVGFKQSFLRLWDLKGMEYFWGLLHPLVLGGLMSLLGSQSIVIARLLSLVCGSLSVGLIYLLVKRYFGWQTALAASLLAIFNPVGIYSDASGMQEPLGILIFLVGIYFWPKKAFVGGVFWMLAGMVRAEYWLMGIGLMLVTLISREKFEKKVLALAGFGILMLLYMKYLLDKTGNAIYPMYWNFLGNMKGEWQADILPTAEQLLVRKVYLGVLLLVIIFGIWLIWKKKPYLLFFSLGLGNWAILALTVGLSQYLLSYLWRFWVDRIMLLPYMFLGIWFCWLIFRLLGKRWLSLVGWFLVLVVILASQFSWQPIWYWQEKAFGQWESKKALAEAVAKHYQEGKILFFENHPASTYWLVYHHQIEGDKIIGQMFDPYFYMEGDPYENWGENREIVLNWLKKEDIRLMAFFIDRSRYLELVEREPEYFEKLDFDQRWNLYIYKVKPELI